MKKLAIFDLDGTLLDTIKDLAVCTNTALSQLGFPTHEVKEYYHFVGKGVDSLFRMALPEEYSTDENVQAVRDIFMPLYDRHGQDFTRPYNGVPEILKSLEAEGIIIAVASNKHQTAVEQLLKGLLPETTFTFILGERKGHPIKPDPDIVLTICRECGVTREETIYIGDSDIDVQTAGNAGVDSIAVTWGFRSTDELEAEHPDYMAYSPEEIPAIIRRAGNTTVRLRNAIAGNPALRLKRPVDIDILKGEQIAILGDNGSGKTLLTSLITGQYPILAGGRFFTSHRKECIRSISFRDSYGSADATWCYQQRWNSTETDDSPFISDLFPQMVDKEWRNELFRVFHLDKIWDKRLVALSSGEMRKYQLAKALSSKPSMIVIDNPYIGLDPVARDELTAMLESLIKEWNLQIVIVISRAAELPSFITHIIRISTMSEIRKMEISEFRPSQSDEAVSLSDAGRSMITSMSRSEMESEEVVRCTDVKLQYGERVIFSGINWVVRRGERWALQGHNGAGKSALLSLIYADNPQAYACNIALFGRRRGTGESIWEIKKYIGYVSPEMHRSYCHHLPVIDIVASGLNDTIGLYRKIHDEERDRCRAWLEVFHLSEFEQRDFCTLSSGEQRMVLLARAFVKNPTLVILDEPLHGLDDRNRELARAIIRTFCDQSGKTLIAVTHYPEELDGITDMVFRL